MPLLRKFVVPQCVPTSSPPPPTKNQNIRIDEYALILGSNLRHTRRAPTRTRVAASTSETLSTISATARVHILIPTGMCMRASFDSGGEKAAASISTRRASAMRCVSHDVGLSVCRSVRLDCPCLSLCPKTFCHEACACLPVDVDECVCMHSTISKYACSRLRSSS